MWISVSDDTDPRDIGDWLYHWYPHLFEGWGVPVIPCDAPKESFAVWEVFPPRELMGAA
jgi:hypothetical protein